METEANQKVWLYSPALDLLVGCAAWSAPLLLLTFWLSKDHGAGLSIGFYALTLVANNPHYMATIFRAYRTKEDFARYRIFTLHLTILLLLTGVIAHWSVVLLPWIYTIYITWSPWHYAGQNFGLSMMFARRGGLAPTRIERNSLYAAFVSSYLMLFLSFHSARESNDPYLLSLGIPHSIVRYGTAILLGVFVASAAYAMRQFFKRANWRAVMAPVTLLASQALWFVVPLCVQMFSGANVPQARYSTGVLAFMHSAQYIWITSYYARKEAEAGTQQAWRPLVYFAVLILGGIALFVPGPWLVSVVLHRDFTTSFLIFAALVNIHHFMLDGAVWKLRDGKIAALLLNSRAALASNARDATSTLVNAARWLTGSSGRARAVRVLAMVLLLAGAGLDQLRYVLGSGRSLANVAFAARLNPYDSTMQLRLAQAANRQGDYAKRSGALQRAVALNPYDADAQKQLVQALIENQKYDEAYDQLRQMFKYVKADSSSYFNYGMLAAQLGHDDEAISNWRQALELDHENILARLQLADALHRAKRYKEAIEQYELYLGAINALAISSQNSDLGSVMYATLQLAEDYKITAQFEKSIDYYERLKALAENARDLHSVSVAWANQASLYGLRGDKAKAIAHAQRALKVDQQLHDALAEGAHWFVLGDLMQRFGAPPELVLTCIYNAEALHKLAPNPNIDKIVNVRVKLVATMDPALVKQTENNLASNSAQALAFHY